MLRVQQLLGGEPARERVGEVDGVVAVIACRFRGQLVGARGHDEPDEMAHVEIMLREVRGELIQQGRMAGWVRRPEVVDGIDDAAADQLEPDPVDLRAGEVGLGGKPVGEESQLIRSGF